MEYIKRCLRVLALLALASPVALALIPMSGWLQGALTLCLLLFYLWFNLCPRAAQGATRRLRAMIGGYELLLDAFLVILGETVLYLVLWRSGVLENATSGAPAWAPLLANLLFFIPVVGILLVNGFFRVLITCKRLRIVWRVLLLTCWWIPLFHLYIFFHVLKCVRSEYYFECARMENEQVHAENEDCRTRYPLVLVHGIFFRDWQLLNYWGRIPQALCRCGATVYYGRQQSAAPVARSAAELKAVIDAIIEKTGCEKVNLIAHSKGGLDSRYAISQLGLAPHVASLTTINTPHRGCVFAGHLLQTLPKGVLNQMERRYNSIFHRLGDAAPDFMGGVRDLTAEACRAFNAQTPDVNGILYQSVMSTMKSGHSASFPLNFTWRLVRKHDQEDNDGLVARSSAKWGDFLGEVTVPGRRGVSHGDIIDLLREDIPAFDVREFYIGIVRGLREKGL